MELHFEEGIKMQCKQMWTFLEIFINGNKLSVFNTVTCLIFS